MEFLKAIITCMYQKRRLKNEHFSFTVTCALGSVHNDIFLTGIAHFLFWSIYVGHLWAINGTSSLSLDWKPLYTQFSAFTEKNWPNVECKFFAKGDVFLYPCTRFFVLTKKKQSFSMQLRNHDGFDCHPQSHVLSYLVRMRQSS